MFGNSQSGVSDEQPGRTLNWSDRESDRGKQDMLFSLTVARFSTVSLELNWWDMGKAL